MALNPARYVLSGGETGIFLGTSQAAVYNALKRCYSPPEPAEQRPTPLRPVPLVSYLLVRVLSVSGGATLKYGLANVKPALHRKPASSWMGSWNPGILEQMPTLVSTVDKVSDGQQGDSMQPGVLMDADGRPCRIDLHEGLNMEGDSIDDDDLLCSAVDAPAKNTDGSKAGSADPSLAATASDQSAMSAGTYINSGQGVQREHEAGDSTESLEPASWSAQPLLPPKGTQNSLSPNSIQVGASFPGYGYMGLTDVRLAGGATSILGPLAAAVRSRPAADGIGPGFSDTDTGRGSFGDDTAGYDPGGTSSEKESAAFDDMSVGLQTLSLWLLFHVHIVIIALPCRDVDWAVPNTCVTGKYA